MLDGHMLLGMTSKSDVRDEIDNSARNIRVLRRRLHDPVEPSSDQVASLLPDLTVIRTTSPLDHRSTWIEVFPREVSKSQAAAWLAARHGIRRGDVCAVGNDYNDRDLLEPRGRTPAGSAASRRRSLGRSRRPRAVARRARNIGQRLLAMRRVLTETVR